MSDFVEALRLGSESFCKYDRIESQDEYRLENQGCTRLYDVHQELV